MKRQKILTLFVTAMLTLTLSTDIYARPCPGVIAGRYAAQASYISNGQSCAGVAQLNFDAFGNVSAYEVDSCSGHSVTNNIVGTYTVATDTCAVTITSSILSAVIIFNKTMTQGYIVTNNAVGITASGTVMEQ